MPPGTNIHPYICHHMVSLDHNELTLLSQALPIIYWSTHMCIIGWDYGMLPNVHQSVCELPGNADISVIYLIQKSQYSERTYVIPWLLMLWLLGSAGHQQPWHWLWSMNRSLSSRRKDLNYLHHLSVEKLYEICFNVFQIKFSTTKVSNISQNDT